MLPPLTDAELAELVFLADEVARARRAIDDTAHATRRVRNMAALWTQLDRAKAALTNALGGRYGASLEGAAYRLVRELAAEVIERRKAGGG